MCVFVDHTSSLISRDLVRGEEGAQSAQFALLNLSSFFITLSKSIIFPSHVVLGSYSDLPPLRYYVCEPSPANFVQCICTLVTAVILKSLL